MESRSDTKKKWDGVGEAYPAHLMTSKEYAKVCAALARVEGLRGTVTAVIGVGLLTSFMTLIADLSVSAGSFETTISVVGVFVPYLLVAAYLRRRLDKHVERLSRGECEPPLLS